MGKTVQQALLILLVVCILAGCGNSTTVILPPETDPPSTNPPPTAESTTAPVSEATAAPTTATATEPSSSAATEPTTEPTEEPTTEPTTTPTVPVTPPPSTAPTSPPPTEPASISLWDILDAINRRRAGQGLSELTMDGTLCDLAQTRAAECSQSFSGTRPNGQSWSSVLEGCGWLYSGENRIYGSTDLGAELIVDTWYSSDSHRANILSSNYLTCGIGIYRSGNTCYIVVLFAG